MRADNLFLGAFAPIQILLKIDRCIRQAFLNFIVINSQDNCVQKMEASGNNSANSTLVLFNKSNFLFGG